MSADKVISLREVNDNNDRPVLCELKVKEEQQNLVVPADKKFKYTNYYASISLAEALMDEYGWFRTINLDEKPIGFVYLHDDPTQGEYWLRRFMIDAEYQGLGYGRQVLQMVIEHVKSRPLANELLLQCLPDPGPAPFFEKMGFYPTGKMVAQEIVMCYQLHKQPEKDSKPVVSLRPITFELVPYLSKMDPQGFVAPNAVSIVQGHFSANSWIKAIFADETPVGLMMLWQDLEKNEFFLWRLMIDHSLQGKGYGRDAIKLLVEYVKSYPGAKELGVSCHPGPDGPQEFYIKQGFVATGEMEDDEMILKMQL